VRRGSHTIRDVDVVLEHLNDAGIEREMVELLLGEQRPISSIQKKFDLRAALESHAVHEDEENDGDEVA
jgi:hypothetical protein